MSVSVAVVGCGVLGAKIAGIFCWNTFVKYLIEYYYLVFWQWWRIRTHQNHVTTVTIATKFKTSQNTLKYPQTFLKTLKYPQNPQTLQDHSPSKPSKTLKNTQLICMGFCVSLFFTIASFFGFDFALISGHSSRNRTQKLLVNFIFSLNSISLI